MKDIGFTKIHTFPYSARKGTPASVMTDQVNGVIKKNRVREVLNLSFELEHQFYQRFVGSVLEGLVEVHKDGKVVVLTSNYISVVVDDKLESNQVVFVKLDSVDDNNVVYGSIVVAD